LIRRKGDIMNSDLIGVAGIDEKGFYIVKPVKWITETGEQFIERTKVYIDNRKENCNENYKSLH
jgi:hypothetical protein